jgi:hypothetical protein
VSPIHCKYNFLVLRIRNIVVQFGSMNRAVEQDSIPDPSPKVQQMPVIFCTIYARGRANTEIFNILGNFCKC